jgi:hypothetical protein
MGCVVCRSSDLRSRLSRGLAAARASTKRGVVRAEIFLARALRSDIAIVTKSVDERRAGVVQGLAPLCPRLEQQQGLHGFHKAAE